MIQGQYWFSCSYPPKQEAGVGESAQAEGRNWADWTVDNALTPQGSSKGTELAAFWGWLFLANHLFLSLRAIGKLEVSKYMVS